MNTFKILLAVHIAAGFVALITAAVAAVTRKGDRAHVYAGRGFVIAMAVIFGTALPMTVIRPNLFLALVAVFSFYQALTGWLRARNRTGRPTPIEWAAAGVMLVTAIAMGARGIAGLVAGNSIGIVLIVFGVIGGLFAANDLRSLRGRRYTGTTRIVAHLTRMLGGTIAVVTAFAVVNIRVEPAFVVWLAPSVVFTPVIAYWSVRVRRAASAPPSLAVPAAPPAPARSRTA